MNEGPAVWKTPPPVQSSTSDRTVMTSRQPYMTESIASKHVCFYKSGDAQFNGLPVVINSRTFKTFEALLDSLSKRVPLPFGVRTITTPRGRTAVRSLDQLYHGQSYICSDKRTVKPVDLERARHKPPPWYHARPLSSRRLSLQIQRQGQRRGQRPAPRGARRATRNQHTTLLHAPRRLIVFRNGDPGVRHMLLLQKRTTHSFEALLDHISEVLRFPVLKLHTPDGSRLDGLSALIMCSGVLIAAGREPFRRGDYDVQKPSAPTWLPAKRVGRKGPMLRKQNVMTSSTKSPFSPSSEHYIVSQIHKGFAGSAYDCPSNPPASVERKTGQLQEAVAETDAIACLDCNDEENIQVPTDEDIEKSFRVNQDGSMTVEMKVHLTLKEEETIQWTTTLSRSSIASQMKCISESPSDLGLSLTDKIPADVDARPSDLIQSCPADPDDVSNKGSSIRHEKMEVVRAEENMGVKQLLFPLTSTLDCSARKLSETKENALGSCGYREETSNGEMKQDCCVLQQSSSRPVPKPRSTLTSELNTSQQKANFYKPPEILQDGGEMVQETTIHVHEQQVCQENFFANTQLCVQGTCGSAMGYAETSDIIFPAVFNKMVPFCSENLESEPQTSITYETLHRHENLHTPQNTNILQKLISTESRMCSPITEFVKPSASRNASTAGPNRRRKPVRVIVKKNHIFLSSASERKRKDNETDILKEIKKIRADIFRQSGAISLSERYRAKVAQKLLKRRNHSANENIRSVLSSTVQLKTQSPNELPAEEQLRTSEKNPAEANLPSRKCNKGSTSPKKDLLHEEHDLHRETRELRDCICLPALHSSSSVFNEYVELWLQKSEHNSHPEQDQAPPAQLKPCPKGSIITAETVSAGGAAEEHLPCCVSLDNTESQKKSSEQNLVLNDNCAERNGIQTALPKNVCLKKAPNTSNATSKNNSTSSELLESLELESSELSKSQTDKPLVEITANGHIKLSPSPRNSSSENTHLSQHFIDLIPQNNTLLKASLFSQRTEGKTTFNRKKTSDKKSDALHSGLNKGLESKSTLLDKSKVNSNAEVSNDNQQSASPQGDTGTCETDKCPSVRMLSDVEMIEKPYTVKMAVRQDMRHILEELFHSIQTLCEVTRHKWRCCLEKRRCCLEKSNSLPDFSSHVAATFGSSSRMLMAFLSVMTLKDSLANLHAPRQAEGNQSCSEALLLLRSLKELAAIEDAEQLTASLNALQNRVSVQLLESWRAFQELNYRSQSHSVMTDFSRSALQEGSEEEVIQGLMEELDVPDRVREELANLCSQEEVSINQVEGSEEVNESLSEVNESLSEVNVNRFLAQLLDDETTRFPHTEKEVNTYAKAVMRKSVKTHLEERGSSVLTMAQLLACTEKEIEMLTGEQERHMCDIERTERDDCVVGSDISQDMSSHEYVLEEKTEVRVAKLVRREEKEEVVAKSKRGQGQDEEDYVLEKNTECSNKLDYVLEKNTECSNTLDYVEEKETVGKVMNARVKDEDRITENDSQSSSSNEGKLTSSEDEKFSLGEHSLGNRFDEEVMSFSEDQVNDEENLQMNALTVIGTNQISLDKFQNEDPISESQSQLHIETYCVEHSGQSGIPATLFAVHVESHVKEDKNHLEAAQGQVIYEEKQIYSEKEQVVLEAPACFTLDQKCFVEQPEHGPDEAMDGCEEHAGHLTGKKKHSNSVAERISNLELAAQRVSSTLVKTSVPHTGLPEVSGTDDLTNDSYISNERDRIEGFKSASSKVETHGRKESEKHVRRVSPKESVEMIRTTKQSHMAMTSELLSSSLTFSYDSPSSSTAQEPEGSAQVNRVKSIREMFLANSNTRKQNVKRHSPSSNWDMSDYKPDSSGSGGDTLTSPEAHSGEDDTGRLAIAKGFVKKTIERLYGRSHSDGRTDVKRPVSAPKGKGRGPGRTHVNSLTSFHEACTQDLSYFNATISFDAFNEPTHCVSKNSQVEPRDAIYPDRGHWVPCENQSIHESSPELQETPKKETEITTTSVKPDQDAVKEDAPYSLFCPASPHRPLPSTELEELSGSSRPKFTYFNLPNASDSDLELEERKSDTPEKTEVKVTPVALSPKSWATLNSFLPAFRPPVVKKSDNKVHPEAAAPIVTQPVRRQSVRTEVIRQSTESDLLEMIFVFCGQHCPIL